MLEYPGGLLDKGTVPARIGPENLVQAPLPDNDVHLLAQARIAQKVLDVQKTAGRSVDGVLGTTVAVDGSRDGHLGIVDVQGMVGVVDRQGHLCPSKRRPGGGACKDHVLHGGATQTLGPLLPHHPGQGIHDVGLPRPVRAHHGRDAGLEPEGGGRGEGLEALERQLLQVHQARSDLGLSRSGL